MTKGIEDSIGCVSAIVAYFGLMGLAVITKIDSGFTFVMAVVGAAIIGFLVNAAARGSSPEGALELIENRKKEALDKKIWITATTVATVYGQAIGRTLQFADSQIELLVTIQGEKGFDVTIRSLPGRGVVFEANVGAGEREFVEKPVLKLTDGGGIKIDTEYESWQETWETINSYIPGPWVKHLQNLKKRAEMERLQRSEAEKIKKMQEQIQAEKHKFGL